MEKDIIYNCDCIKGLREMPDNSVDAVITSPPYNYNLRIQNGKYTRRSLNDKTKYNKTYDDAMSMDEYFKWQRDCIAEMLRVSRGLVFYNIQMINGNKLALFRLFGEFSEYIKEVIIWDKNNAEPAIHDGVLNSRYEYIIVLDKTNAISRQFNVFNANRGTVENIWKINKNTERGIANHNAMFPVDLPRKIIQLFTRPNDLILDPFMGGGTTAVACVLEGRNFIGFEINNEYFVNSIKRIENTKKQLTIF